LGNIYSSQKDYEAALSIYDKALRSLPDTKRFPEILFDKGMTLAIKNSLDDANAVFQQVIQDYSGTVFADKSKLELGIVALDAKKFEEAETYFQDLTQNRTDEIGAQAQYYYGVSLFDQKNYDEAITALVRVNTIFPAYDEWVSRSYLKLGDCYVKRNDKERARELYRNVYSKHKNDDLGIEARTKLRDLR
jgi:TolA-binding protein